MMSKEFRSLLMDVMRRQCGKCNKCWGKKGIDLHESCPMGEEHRSILAKQNLIPLYHWRCRVVEAKRKKLVEKIALSERTISLLENRLATVRGVLNEK